ncbi:MAG: hypothetical protein QXW94_04985 [Desulfurococcaceae archaeon]
MVVRIGSVEDVHLKDVDVLVVGLFKVSAVLSEKTAVLIGEGIVNILSSLKCILVSTVGPIVVNQAHCVNLLAVGEKQPVALGFAKAKRVFARKAYIQRLNTREAYLGDLCSIDLLEHADRLIFADPHTYIKRAKSIGEVYYAYETMH